MILLSCEIRRVDRSDATGSGDGVRHLEDPGRGPCRRPRKGKPKLLDQVRDAIRTRHYSYRTEEACVGWSRRFIFFHHKPHPAEVGPPEIMQFLTTLAVERHVSASTQNQALAALLFLYREVCGCDPRWLDGIVRAKRPERLPVVLTREEVQALLAALDGISWIMARRLYGAGLRLIACLRLRVKAIEFSRSEIVVREGKGHKDRVTMLPGCGEGSAAGAPPSGACSAHGRLTRWIRPAPHAGRAGGKVPKCQPRVGVAVGVCGHPALQRSALW